MSRFYGTLEGSRGQATRCGTAESGMRASAQSYTGSLIATVYADNDDQNIFTIEMNNGTSPVGREMLRGTYDELVKLLNYANMHRNEILRKN